MTTNDDRTAILVVEDEEAIQRGLCDVLAFHGHDPTGVGRGDQGLQAALDGDYALVLLDVMMPGLNGFEVCEKLRAARPALPVLMLTARGAEGDVLNGFRCGADDYVTKPFSVAELMARVDALLRRARTDTDPETPEDPEPFGFGDWCIDPRELRATRDDRTLELTRRDADVLCLLAREAGRIVSRRRLLRDIWGYPDPERVETRSVDMHIAKLRKKLDAAGDALIETVRGEGYRYGGGAA